MTDLRAYWHPVARTADVNDQPRRFRLLGEDLVLFRHDDEVRAFSDLCIHRGAALSLGSVTDGRLTCPYHGWQYDADGQCVRIPALPEGTPIPSKARALKYEARERYGLVWVSLEPGPSAIPRWPNDETDDPAFVTFIAGQYSWQTSAGRSVENFMDFSHFPFVHAGLLGLPDRTIVQSHQVARTGFGLQYDYEGIEPGGYYDGGELGAPTEVRRTYSLYLPYTIHSAKRDAAGSSTVISLFVCPVDVNRSLLWVVVARNHHKDADDYAAWNKRFIDFNDEIMEQDRVVVESQRPEGIPLHLREELHIKIPDAAGLAYRSMLREIAGDVQIA